MLSLTNVGRSYSRALGYVALVVVACGLGAAGCSNGQVGPRDNPPINVDDSSLSFPSEGDTLRLTPGQIYTLTVQATPVGRAVVNFHLVGEVLDGSLDATSVVSSADGRAQVTLKAPNGATTFAVRASIEDGPSGELAVSVSGEGFGTIGVKPEYAGRRETKAWKATVLAGTSCEAIAENLPAVPLGGLEATANEGTALQVDDVPVGPNLAIIVKAGGYMWGCTNETALLANEEKEVVVTINDRPVALDSTFDASFTIAPDAAWMALMNRSLDDLLVPLATSPLAQSVAQYLADHAPDPNDAASAFATYDWPSQVATHWQNNSINLQDLLRTRFGSGAEAAAIVAEGKVYPGLANTDGEPFVFELTSIGGELAEALGVSSPSGAVLTVDGEDMAHFGTSVAWFPGRLAGHFVQTGVMSSQPMAANFADALGAEAMCATLMVTGLNQCDAACMNDLCSRAVAAAFDEALVGVSTTSSAAELSFDATGPIAIDDEASLVGFDGMWLGYVSQGTESTKVQGTATFEAQVKATIPAPGGSVD